jgi:hypothetical protein
MNRKIRRSLVTLVAAGALVVPFAGIASAGAPAVPGGFGQGRAEYATENGSLGHQADMIREGATPTTP